MIGVPQELEVNFDPQWLKPYFSLVLHQSPLHFRVVHDSDCEAGRYVDLLPPGLLHEDLSVRHVDAYGAPRIAREARLPLIQRFPYGFSPPTRVPFVRPPWIHSLLKFAQLGGRYPEDSLISPLLAPCALTVRAERLRKCLERCCEFRIGHALVHCYPQGPIFRLDRLDCLLFGPEWNRDEGLSELLRRLCLALLAQLFLRDTDRGEEPPHTFFKLLGACVRCPSNHS